MRLQNGSRVIGRLYIRLVADTFHDMKRRVRYPVCDHLRLVGPVGAVLTADKDGRWTGDVRQHVPDVDAPQDRG